MTPADAKLAALIGSRICHDLISPIGAINNGLELLGMTGSTEGPELELISESVVNASARIRFFRIAFGAAGAQMIGRNEAQGVLQDLMGGGRVTIEYLPEDPQPRRMVRLAFLSILCLEAALPYGGVISVSCTEGRWRIRGGSEKMNVDEVLWTALADPAQLEAIEPAQVQFALLPTLARDENISLSTELGAQAIDIRF